jgi:hypothetical protein
MSSPMIKPYPEAETPLLSAMAGKKGGNRQTVREEAHVDTITMMNMFSCLQNSKEIKEYWGRREKKGRRCGRRPTWTQSQ